MRPLVILFVLGTCTVSAVSAGWGNGKGKGWHWGWGWGWGNYRVDNVDADETSLQTTIAVDATGRCNPRGDIKEDQVPSVDVEPVSQLRTLIGGHTTDVGACPVGTCRYDPRRHEKCSKDGYICPQTEEREVDVGEYGNYTVNVVTACKCCKDNGITIRGHVVDAATGAPVANADLHVTLKSSATSDSNGSFSLMVSSDNTRVVINAERAGYVSAMKVVEITNDFKGPYDVVVGMVKIAEPIDIDSTIDNELPVSDDPSNPNESRAFISIPARSFRTRRGVYRGIVKISVNFINTADPNVEDEIPGLFLTDDGEPLESDGIFSLDYQSENGEPLRMGPVTVTVAADMRLWILNSDGLWTPTGSGQGRGKRQTASPSDIQARIERGQWVNIDKIPRAPKCYFKGRIFDEFTGIEIASSNTALFRPSIISYRIPQNQRLRFYPPSTSDPATTCYEVRCPDVSVPNNTLVGLITMKSYELVSIGGVLFPLVTALKPRSLPAYSVFSPTLPPSLNAVQYTVLPSAEDLYASFISNINGPFYTDKTTCEGSTIIEPSFHFLKAELPSYVPYPDDANICTARIGFIDIRNFYYTLYQLDFHPIVTAVSTWAIGGINYYYTDSAIMEFSDIGGDFVYVCIKYRCSTADANTTVSLDFGTPVVTINRTRNNKDFQYEVPAFHCYGNCSTQNCNQNGGDIPSGGQGTSIDGSFFAPLDISAEGPDFYEESSNDCAGRAKNEKFAAVYQCYGNKFWQEPAVNSTAGVAGETPARGVL